MRFVDRDAQGRFVRLLRWGMVLCIVAFCATGAIALNEKRIPRDAVLSKAAFRSAARRAIRKQCSYPERMGLYVRSVSTAQTLFSHRAAVKRIPASNVKLLTAAAALARLGPDYQFATDFYAAAELRGGVLHGDLYLKGYGDPLFVHEKMRDLVRRLNILGVRDVAGDLVADDTFFDAKRYGRGWRVGRSIQPYLAPHGALSLNFGLANVVVVPGDKPGRPARARLEPSSRALRLKSSVSTSRGGRPRIRLGRERLNGKDVVRVSGSIPPGEGMRTYRAPVSDPTAFVAGAVLAEFERQGIGLEGGMRQAETPPDARLLARNLSPPLGEIVRGLNKHSNNFVAEQILKTLGAEARGAPGTAEKGLRVVRDFLVAIGVPAEEFDLADGSGLSRRNRVSPRALVVLLEAVHNDFRLRPELMSSLAVFGVDGTVRSRRPASAASRRVRVKTGMLRGVSALSGYAAARNGEVLAFSVLMNGDACRPKALTLALVRSMIAFSRKFPAPVNAHFEGARKMMGRPMPKPYLRDRWRRRSAPRPRLAGVDASGTRGSNVHPLKRTSTRAAVWPLGSVSEGSGEYGIGEELVVAPRRVFPPGAHPDKREMGNGRGVDDPGEAGPESGQGR